MKKMMIAKNAAVLLAALMSLSFVSCGSGDSSSAADAAESTVQSAAEEDPAEPSATAEDKEITGTVETWGVYTVLVPDGWKLRKGDVLDENSPDYCSVKKSDLSWIDFKNEKEETQKKQYEYNHKTYTYNQKDLPAVTIAGIEWNGFEYGDDFTPGFELYGQSNGKFIRVSGAGFKFDSPEAKAVLESLKIG